MTTRTRLHMPCTKSKAQGDHSQDPRTNSGTEQWETCVRITTALYSSGKSYVAKTGGGGEGKTSRLNKWKAVP